MKSEPKKHTRTLTKPVLCVLITCAALSKNVDAVECPSCVSTTISTSNATQSLMTAGFNALGTALTALQASIINAISAQTGALGNQATQAAQSVAHGNLQTAQATQKNTIAQKIGGPAALQSTCAASSSAASRSGSGSGGSSSGAGQAYTPGNIHERLRRAIDVAGISDSPMIPPIAVQLQQSDLGVGACKTFADPRSPRGLMCAAAGATPVSLNKYPNADILAGTLIDGPQLRTRAFTINRSMPAQGPEYDARQNLITNLTAASPPAAPTSQAMKEPEILAYLGLKTEYDAAMSLAAHPITDYFRVTTIDTNTLEALNKINSMDGPFVQRFFTGIDSTFYSSGVSPLTLMELEVERRTGNADWFTRLAAMDDTARQVEQVTMQAYQMRLQRLQIQQSYETNMLLGKLLNMQVQAVYKPLLEKTLGSVNSAVVNRSSGTTPK